MADAIVGVLIENVNSLIKSEFGLFMGVEDDIQKLSSILSTIQAVLQDAEIEKITNNQIANWLAKLKDAAYDASDILEEWSMNAQQPSSNGDQVGTSDFSCLSLNRCTSRQSIARKTKKVINKLEEIAQERSKFHLISSSVPTSTRMELVESRETSSFLEVDVVHGRDADREKIIEVLLNNVSREEDVSVYSIVGMGGLGKTTLAQLVYNDDRIAAHFEKRAWVCVSEDFEVKKLAAMILESVITQACKTEGLDTIQRQVKEELSGKKFLLVLDDVWNEDQAKWNKLKSALRCGAKGSSILVTTRLEKVSSIMSTLEPHQLKFLTEEDCWSLFKDCAFGVGREETAELVEIGKQIVQKCGGVPLAIKTLGRLMRSKKKAAEWMQVRDSKIWTLPQDEGTDILPALRLSYNNLPYNLKPCFVFCAIYPKDYEMDKEELIQLWMANGFLQSNENMELEECGDLYFDELLHRSFFQEVKMDDFGDIESCKMHDLIHDLACSVSSNECGIVELGSKTLPKSIRHCSLVLDLPIREQKLINLETFSKSYPMLRTHLVLHVNLSSVELIFRSLSCCLRALDLSGTCTNALPASIGKMKHLRYLNMSWTAIRLLPESICNLRNLQCLKLQWCRLLEELPKEMSKMKGLRHLDIRRCDKLKETPIWMGQLTQLRTLSLFVVGKGMESGRSIAELRGMNLLGEIQIRGLENVRSLEEAKEVNLMNKQNISMLGMCWSREILDMDDDRVGPLQEKVLEEGLQPHPSSLKALSIDGYKGRMLPSWMDQLQKLVKISLKGCSNCEHLRPLWRLPLLKNLSIKEMRSVKYIIDDDDDVNNRAVGGPWFPKLEKLKLECMDNLEEWWSSSSLSKEVLLFPCLKELRVNKLPKLGGLPPCLSHLQILKLENCNEMMLRRSLENPIPLLNSLRIMECNEMTCLPQGIFLNCSTSLTCLRIWNCEELKSVGAEICSLTALTELWIEGCRELNSLSELEGILCKLTSLTLLSIQYCPSVKCLPVLGGIQGPVGFQKSQTRLIIGDCDNLTSVSEGLQYPTLLDNLYIGGCPKLDLYSREAEEGFQHLISLRYLTFFQLPQLTVLPEWIQHLPMLQSLEMLECENLKSLPGWLQRITTLQSLEIINCNPDVHKRCKKDKGEDWHIISRIPHVHISDPKEEEEAASTSAGAGCFSAVFNKLRRNTCLNHNN